MADILGINFSSSGRGWGQVGVGCRLGADNGQNLLVCKQIKKHQLANEEAGKQKMKMKSCKGIENPAKFCKKDPTGLILLTAENVSATQILEKALLIS